jgi:tRNA (Thr-GGU) A37 N-methylase
MEIKAIATVKNSRKLPEDDHWEEFISEILLSDHIPTAALDNISDFSHLEVIYLCDKAKANDIVCNMYF